jgi:hypothetical protein
MRARQKTQLFILTALLTSGFAASAQNLNDQVGPKSTKENSPYSRFGIGDISNPYNSIVRGMGGTATAYNDDFNVNTYNPATYSYLKVTTLDFAFEARRRSIFMNNVSTSSGTATLSYLTLGIPFAKGNHAGMAVGFMPLSSMYYNANDTVNNDIGNIGKGIVNYNGSGSLNYAYAGFSGRIKGFSIGFNAGYAFGSSRYSSTLESIDTTSVRNSEFTQINSIGGLYWKGGAMYQARFKKEHYLNLGAAVTLAQQLNVTREAYDIGYRYFSGSTGLRVIRDTVAQTRLTGAKGKLELPADYSFGAHFGKDYHWDIGADFVYSDWSKFSNFGDRTNVGTSAMRISLGGEVTPDPSAKDKLASVITYRLGVYYAQDYLEFGGTKLNDIGGTIGASIPLKRNFSQFGRLNTSLNLGQRGTIVNNLAREFYVRFTIGVSLNEIWFRRPQYD